jgi:K+-sensing histidine kinase KdpD
LLSSLFERKPPANASCPQDSPDIGMGLHICSEIIHAHQGQITAKSLPEAGTCLTFTLPLESRHRPLAKHWERAIQKNKNIQWKAYA